MGGAGRLSRGCVGTGADAGHAPEDTRKKKDAPPGGDASFRFRDWLSELGASRASPLTWTPMSGRRPVDQGRYWSNPVTLTTVFHTANRLHRWHKVVTWFEAITGFGVHR